MKNKVFLAVSLVLVLCIAAGCAYLPLGTLTAMYSQQSPQQSVSSDDPNTVTISREAYETYQKFDKLIEMMEITKANFYQPVDENALLEKAAQGLLMGLDDPYSFYYTPEEYAEMWEDDEGEYAGIGIQISSSYVTGICTVSRVFANSPAREAGVHKGDILYKVEDMYVSYSNINDAVDIMRGTPGTTVNVTFLRDGDEVPLVIERANIVMNRVESLMLADEIGYVILYEFAGDDCTQKFAQAVDSLEAQGAKGLIIDLRDNPGGWVDAAQGIADLFLDSGIVCYLEYNNGGKYYYRTADGRKDLELVILVNENSASSSEILTGCLKDRANATVVGKQSFGKGIVQSVIPVSTDGSGMQITIAQYFTPNGNAVHKIGITPDVEADLDEGDNGMHEFGDLTDAQLACALEVMQHKLEQANSSANE